MPGGAMMPESSPRASWAGFLAPGRPGDRREPYIPKEQSASQRPRIFYSPASLRSNPRTARSTVLCGGFRRKGEKARASRGKGIREDGLRLCRSRLRRDPVMDDFMRVAHKRYDFWFHYPKRDAFQEGFKKYNP